MSETNFSEKNGPIESMGIKDATVHWNLSPEELAEISIEQGLAKRASNGAINVSTGEFTGRSPNDRFIVFDNITEDTVWWGDINLPFETHKFDLLYDHMIEYLSGKEIYVRDGYACADPKYKMNIRFVTEIPWSNMFVYNMFLRPTEDELVDFDPE